PANSIILAEIWVPAGAAAITGAEIYDKRVSIADFLTHESATTGVHGVGASAVCSEAEADNKITTHAHLSINEQTGASYTLVLGDDGKLIDMNSAAAQTLTVPTNASVAFLAGTQILVRQKGAGQVTVSPAGGVTLEGAGNEFKTRVQHSMVGLMKVATDTWVMFGDTAV
ncbi:unnamed protein product, partial [marine sediment metagenome]